MYNVNTVDLMWNLWLDNNLCLSSVRFPRPLHASDWTGLPEGEGPARHARLLGDAERQPAAEHGGRAEDGAQRPPDADIQVSFCLWGRVLVVIEQIREKQ